MFRSDVKSFGLIIQINPGRKYVIARHFSKTFKVQVLRTECQHQRSTGINRNAKQDYNNRFKANCTLV